MDYFFAQIEERENQWLKNKLVVVGANPKKGRGRGVVSTCNYKAREYGIKSGMPISRAYKIAPDAIFLPVNMAHYANVSKSIFSIIKKTINTEKIEHIALDEAYIDATCIIKNLKEGITLGRKIKSKILEEEELTCTIGVSENKMLAKIACNIVKPDGINAISAKKGKEIINEMNIKIIPGIGPKTEKIIENYLKKNNLKVKDAKIIKEKELIKILGKRGSVFYNNFRGIDLTEVKSKKIIKSIGREHTFEKDKENPKEVISIFKKLVTSVEEELNEKKLQIKTISVICRFENFKKYTKQKKFTLSSYNKEILYKESIPLLLDIIIKNNRRIRLIGFRVIVK